MRYLGIDYGLRRTGLALSDPDGKLAFPLATLDLASFPNRAGLLDALAQIAIRNNAEALVMGLPLHGDGSESETSRQVRNASQRIMRRLPLPMYLMPEYLSSACAESELKEAGLRGSRLRAALDQQAACRILASFLEQPDHLRMRA